MRRLVCTAVSVALVLMTARPLRSAPGHAVEAAAGGSPTIDDLISLKRVGSPAISPDGRIVAHTIRETN